MQVTFLGHGLDSKESVGSVLIESFLDTDFNRFSCFVAFASVSGINGIIETIQKSKDHIKHFNVFIGIDHKGTSKEALETLLSLDIGASIYYTFSPVTFHPKIYSFEGDKKCRIILGSSNLTKAGLFQNIEASFIIDYVKPDKEGEKLLAQLYDYFKSFFDGKDENLHGLTKELIEELVESDIIPGEPERVEIQEKEPAIKRLKKAVGKEDLLQRLKELFPPIKIQKPPKGFKTIWDLKGDLLWRKPNLPASDVQYRKEGTNPTGCLRLTQAGWNVDGQGIDQTTYFREDLFGGFEWELERTSPKAEVAKVSFWVKVSGEDKGLHSLKIRHKPSGEAGQGNYTTSISWGKLGNLIRDSDLQGKTFSLFAPANGQKEPFYIEIE